METMAISKFKASCLSVLEKVRRTRKPVLVTRFGKPVAQIIPPPPGERKRDWIGSFAHTGFITGDIVSPVVAEDEWEVLRDEPSAGHSHLALDSARPRKTERPKIGR